MGGKKRMVEKTNKPAMEKRINSLWLLDVFRGLSALLIVLYHYTTQYDKSIGHLAKYNFSFPWGCHAVYAFFMLSGFLIVYTYKENFNMVSFLKKRCVRLYPMFWVCMVVTTIYMAFIFPERVPSVRQFLLNITMFPTLFGSTAIDGVYWTMPKELIFYIIFAIIACGGGLKGKQKAKWLWLCIVIEVICLIYCFGPFDLPAQWGIIFFMIPDYMYVFLAGCAVYYLNYTENLQQKGMMIIYLVICTVVCKCLCSESTFIFFIFSLCMLILCSREKTNQKTEGMKQILRPFIFLSEISYVLYLTHQFIGFGIIRKMEMQGMTAEVWILLPIAHAILLATILHYGVELKINQMLKRCFAKI